MKKIFALLFCLQLAAISLQLNAQSIIGAPIFTGTGTGGSTINADSVVYHQNILYGDTLWRALNDSTIYYTNNLTGDTLFILITDGVTDNTVYYSTSDFLNFQIDGATEGVVIDAYGRVGIGMPASTALAVDGIITVHDSNSSNEGVIYFSGDTFRITSADGPVKIGNNSLLISDSTVYTRGYFTAVKELTAGYNSSVHLGQIPFAGFNSKGAMLLQTNSDTSQMAYVYAADESGDAEDTVTAAMGWVDANTGVDLAVFLNSTGIHLQRFSETDTAFSEQTIDSSGFTFLTTDSFIVDAGTIQVTQFAGSAQKILVAGATGVVDTSNLIAFKTNTTSVYNNMWATRKGYSGGSQVSDLGGHFIVGDSVVTQFDDSTSGGTLGNTIVGNLNFFTAPYEVATATVFGFSNVVNSGSVIVGYGNIENPEAANNIIIGNVGDVGDIQNVFIAGVVNEGSQNVAIGWGSGGAPADSINSSIAIGHDARITDHNQCVIGSQNAAITHMYVGSGINNTTPPTDITIHASSAEAGQTDLTGADMTLAAGQPTGSGTSGELLFQTAPTGASGTTLRTLATAGKFDATTTAGQTRFFLYDVDNGTLERVTVGAADSGGAGFKVLRIPN